MTKQFEDMKEVVFNEFMENWRQFKRDIVKELRTTDKKQIQGGMFGYGEGGILCYCAEGIIAHDVAGYVIKDGKYVDSLDDVSEPYMEQQKSEKYGAILDLLDVPMTVHIFGSIASSLPDINIVDIPVSIIMEKMWSNDLIGNVDGTNAYGVSLSVNDKEAFQQLCGYELISSVHLNYSIAALNDEYKLTFHEIAQCIQNGWRDEFFEDILLNSAFGQTVIANGAIEKLAKIKRADIEMGAN